MQDQAEIGPLAGAEGGREALAAALRRIAAGDRRAFEDLYHRTSAKLFGVCLRILPTRTDAEEVLQEAYLAVWRKAGSFDATRGSAMTWLLALTRNQAIDRLRASNTPRTAPAELAEQIADPQPGPQAIVEAGEGERTLARCLEDLDANDAGFVRTAFFEGVTYAELADRTGLPLGTLKSRIRRALLRLRACLE